MVDFYGKLPGNKKKGYSITYDFHLLNKDGESVIINHISSDTVKYYRRRIFERLVLSNTVGVLFMLFIMRWSGDLS